MSHFPLFIDISTMKILCIGAGSIGIRRINVLKEFGAEICVISKENVNIEGVSIKVKEYEESDITDEYSMVIAATNSLDINESIIKTAKKAGVKYYNNVSDKSMCNFYFPAVIKNNDIICGLISKDGKSHKTAKDYAAYIRDVL